MKLSLSLKTILIVTLISACGKTKFADSTTKTGSSADQSGTGSDTSTDFNCLPPCSTSSNTNTDSGGGGNGTPGHENWSVARQDGKVDVMMIVDSGGSITGMVQSIQNNITPFQQQMAAKKVNMNFMLVATPKVCDGGYSGDPSSGIDLTKVVGATGVPVSYCSGTNDGSELLAVAAGVSCKDPNGFAEVGITEPGSFMSTGRGIQICGVMGTKPMTISSSNNMRTLMAKAHGGNFLRQDAKMVYVFISDSQQAGFLSDEFLKVISASNGIGKKPFVFSFRDTNKSIYFEDLAKKTGAMTFDIYGNDWKMQFDKLIDRLLPVSGVEYTLKQAGVKQLTGVTINKAKKELSCVNLRDNRVSVSPACINEVASGDSVAVEVSYLY